MRIKTIFKYLVGARVSLALMLLSFCANSSLADDGLWKIADEPDWGSQAELVIPQDEESVGGRYYNIAETHSRFESDPTQSVYYQRFVYTINNASGLDESDAISIEFDPLFQHVLLHKVQLIRGEQTISQLDADNVQLLQRETELESGLYDGKQTLHLLLSDQRVGDRVEYSFSLVGRNPVFGDHVFGWARLQAGVPVGNYYYRLRYPKHKAVDFRTYVNDPEMTEVVAGDYKEVTFREIETEASYYQSNVPYSFLAETYVQYSSFKDWAAVIDWGAPLYALPAQATESVAVRARSIQSEWATPDQQVDAAIRFVQDDIRYTGINSGIGGYKPDSPESIINRRYGDCKDKSVLLVALLQELGIQAYPTLVHTRDGKGMSDYLPSPDAFNHMIVKLPYRGKDYWVDGTMSLQGGSLDTLVQGGFHNALVIGDDLDDLESYQLPSPVLPTKEVSEYYHLRHNADDKPTLLTIHTTFRGEDAEYIRQSLQSKGPHKLQSDYVNFYRNRFGTVRTVGPLEVSDNRVDNVLELTERYEIPQAWDDADDEGEYEVEFVADSIYDYVGMPKDKRREQPLAQRYPVSVSHSITVRLDDGWDIEPDTVEITNEFFSYQGDVQVNGDELVLVYTLQTHDDTVPVKSARKYIRELKRVRSDAYYPVHFSLPHGTEPAYFLESQLSNIGSWFRQNAQQISAGEEAALGE